MTEALAAAGSTTTGRKYRGSIGMLMLDDPHSPSLMAHSPYLATRIVEACTVDGLVIEADTRIEAPMVAAARARRPGCPRSPATAAS